MIFATVSRRPGPAICLLIILIPGLFISGAATAQGPGSGGGPRALDNSVAIHPGDQDLFIAESELLGDDEGSGLSIASVTQPHHGTLTAVSGGYVYTPNARLWSLGTDSFTYTLGGPPSSSAEATATVLVHTTDEGQVAVIEGFESPLNSPTAYSGSTQIRTDAAVNGNQGLRIYGPGPSYGEIFLEPNRGNGVHGTTVRMTIRPPNRPPVLGPPGIGDVIFSVGDGPFGTPAIITLSLRQTPEDKWELSAGGSNGQSTAWLPVEGEIAKVKLHWYRNYPPSQTGGILLNVDNQGIASMDFPGIPANGYYYYLFGDPVGRSDDGVLLDLDDLEIWSDEGTGGDPIADPVMVDDFETADCSSWLNEDPTLVQATTSAAMTGAWGMEAKVRGERQVGRGLLDDSPEAATDYGARFLLDTSALALGVGDTLVIFSGYDTNDRATSNSVFELEVERKNDIYVLLARATENGVSLSAAETQAVTLDPGTNLIEMQWRAGFDSPEDSGYIRLAVNQQAPVSREMVDNNGRILESVRLGSLERTGLGAGGFVWVDGFESWTHY